MSSRRLQDMSSRHPQDMPSRRLQDMFLRRLQDVFSVTIFRLPRCLCKMSSRRLQDQQMFAGKCLQFTFFLQILFTSGYTAKFSAKFGHPYGL